MKKRPLRLVPVCLAAIPICIAGTLVYAKSKSRRNEITNLQPKSHDGDHLFSGKPYHLHFNTEETISPALADELKKRGLRLDDFSGAPPGVETTKPPGQHWTREYDQKEKTLWKQHTKELHRIAGELGYKGYIEAENVPVEYRFDNRAKNPNGLVKSFPVKLAVGKLSQQEGERFKKAEIHVSMKRETSNPNLQQELITAGFLPVYWRDEVIFTAQGFNREIKKLERLVHEYIKEVGGGHSVQILREHIASEAQGGFSLHGVGPEDLNSVVRKLLPVAQ